MNLVDQFLLRLLVVIAQIALMVYKASGDDTALIQSYLDKADAAGVVTLPPGEYECKPLRWNFAIKYLFGHPSHRTTLRLAPQSAKADRVFLIKNTNGGEYHATIAHITFDGNRSNQTVGHDTSGQQGFLFVEGEKNGTSRAAVSAYDVDCLNSAGDFIYVYHQGELHLYDFTAKDVFRAGVGITGKGCRVHIRDGDFIDCGIDIEPNSASDVVDVLVERVELDKFDVGMETAGSRCVVRRVKQNKPLVWYLYCAAGATFECSDSQFVTPPDTRCKVRLCGTSTFERCTFTNPTTTKYGNILNLLWSRGNPKQTDQVFTLRDCVLTGPAFNGIDTGIDSAPFRNTLRLENVQINGTDKAVVKQGSTRGNWVWSNVTDDGVEVRP